jgi:hypothetical protein
VGLDDKGDGVPALFDGKDGGLSQQRLELGKCVLDRFEVGL